MKKTINGTDARLFIEKTILKGEYYLDLSVKEGVEYIKAKFLLTDEKDNVFKSNPNDIIQIKSVNEICQLFTEKKQIELKYKDKSIFKSKAICYKINFIFEMEEAAKGEMVFKIINN